jgi:hypothetical protein
MMMARGRANGPSPQDRNVLAGECGGFPFERPHMARPLHVKKWMQLKLG